MIISYISRLGPFVWVLNFEFPLMEVRGAPEKSIFFKGVGVVYGEILDIFGGGGGGAGVITKLDYFWVSFIYIIS